MPKRYRDAPLRTIVDRSGRAGWMRSKGQGHPGWEELLRPGSTKKRRWDFNANRRRVKKITPADGPSKVSAVEKARSDALKLPVPTPSERIRPDDVSWFSREGQKEFRRAIIEAYGRCAVTGCRVEAALEAAHIIPYVDARSHIITNGLCLRADIHRLFDRNVIRIGQDGIISVDASVSDEYGTLDGSLINLPARLADYPNHVLLSVRHLYLSF